MRRNLKLFIIALAVILPLSFVASPRAHAVYTANQTQAEATACKNKYDYNKTNKTYTDGSSQIKEFLTRDCFSKKGNCTTKPGATNKTLKIACTNQPGTNTAVQEQAESDSADATEDFNDKNAASNAVLDGNKDPALGVTCDKNSCEIVDKFINPTIRLLTVLVGIAVVIGIIFGGIQVSTSAGDPQKAASGKDHIRNAIIALIAYAVLFAFLQFIIPGGVT